MSWYYAVGEQKVGPVSKTDLKALIQTKKIGAQTMIWRPGMTDWQTLGAIVRQKNSQNASNRVPSAAPVQRATCMECGQTYPRADMIPFKESWICGQCKPLFVQKVKEGVPVAGVMDYAGFWIRFAAVMIDGMIMWFINGLIYIPFAILTGLMSEQPMMIIMLYPVLMLLQYGINAAYETWFIGKYSATPGKMACKLKVVVADGSRVSYLRALGRHFAKWLSSLILLIGFIMAAFDEEKRGLHDRICETRVVRK